MQGNLPVAPSDGAGHEDPKCLCTCHSLGGTDAYAPEGIALGACGRKSSAGWVTAVKRKGHEEAGTHCPRVPISPCTPAGIFQGLLGPVGEFPARGCDLAKVTAPDSVSRKADTGAQAPPTLLRIPGRLEPWVPHSSVLFYLVI